MDDKTAKLELPLPEKGTAPMLIKELSSSSIMILQLLIALNPFKIT